jgi:hypothetical protein
LAAGFSTLRFPKESFPESQVLSPLARSRELSLSNVCHCGLPARIHDEPPRKQPYGRNRGGSLWIAGVFRRENGAEPVIGLRLARTRWRLLPGRDSVAKIARDGASRPASMKRAGIGNEPNDSAEHGCDQDGLRAFTDLMHAPTMRGVQPRIKSQLNQNGRSRAPSAKTRITYFRNIVIISPQSPLTQAAIPPSLRGAFDQRLQTLGGERWPVGGVGDATP